MMKRMVTFALFIAIILALTTTALAAGSTQTTDTNLYVKLAVVILVPLLIALIVCSVWRSKMKTAKLARAADNYIPQGGFNLTERNDIFLYRTTTRRRIESSSSSSGGGVKR